MDPILNAGLWETIIGGVRFVSRRKCTAVMVQARGFMAVVGQMAEGGSEVDVKADDYLKMVEACFRAAVIEPAVAPAGGVTIPGEVYAYDDLRPFAEPWFAEFMKSGLTAGPSPDSCGD